MLGARGAGSRFPGHLAWQVLHSMDHFPSRGPATLKAALLNGRLTVEELAGRYKIRHVGVRHLLIAFLERRKPELDYSTLDNLSRREYDPVPDRSRYRVMGDHDDGLAVGADRGAQEGQQVIGRAPVQVAGLLVREDDFGVTGQGPDRGHHPLLLAAPVSSAWSRISGGLYAA